MKKRSKKEILITVAGGVALCGMLGTMTGCFGKADELEMLEIGLSFYTMEQTNDCLACVGCINMQSSDGGCCGGPSYTYIGCVDCFGCTTNDDTEANDVNLAYELCGGYYCVNVGVPGNDSVTPVYGCYKKK